MSDTIGDYRLVEKIGEGAAGEVFLATPLIEKAFARPGDPVAVKRYKPDILRQAKQFDRIEREFRVGSQLSHPNLVRIYEYSPATKDNPTPFLVMEYVDGVSLDKWIDQFHPIPGRLLLRLSEQLLDAVSSLHDNGVLHRDLKPQNTMVTSTFDVKVMDLGVVRISSDTPITPKEQFLGTIRNSSPEMLFGKDYNERTDLYSLGTIFYALLHGEQVYADEEQWARLTRRIETGDPRFDQALRGDDNGTGILFDVTQQLLKRTAEERPASCKDVSVMLQPAHATVTNAEPLGLLHGYIATALTGLEPDSRDAIMFASSRIAELAKAYNLYVYQPRKATDPLLHKNVDASTVYRLDRQRVVAADLLIVIANRPSFGVGQEIEIATSYSIPTILLTREGTTVSRMVTGSPANILDEIVYATPEELERKLRRSLGENIDKVRKWRNMVRIQPTTSIGHRLATLREENGYGSATELADSLGVSARLLDAIEHGDYDNVSLHLIERVAIALGASLTDLVSPQVRRAVTSVPTSDVNTRRLENTARKLGWSASTFFELRDDYQRQLAASGQSQGLSEEQWVARHSVLEKRRLKEFGDGETRQRSFFSTEKD